MFVAVVVDEIVDVDVDDSVGIDVDVDVNVIVDVGVNVEIAVSLGVAVGAISFAVSRVTNGKYTRGAGHSATARMRLLRNVGVSALPERSMRVAEVRLTALNPTAVVLSVRLAIGPAACCSVVVMRVPANVAPLSVLLITTSVSASVEVRRSMRARSGS